MLNCEAGKVDQHNADADADADADDNNRAGCCAQSSAKAATGQGRRESFSTP